MPDQLWTTCIHVQICVFQSDGLKYYVSTLSEWETLAWRQWCHHCEVSHFPGQVTWPLHTFSPTGFRAIIPLYTKHFVRVSTYLWSPNNPRSSLHSSSCHFPQAVKVWSVERKRGSRGGEDELFSALFFISFHLLALQRDGAIKECNHWGTYYIFFPFLEYTISQPRPTQPFSSSRIQNSSRP